VSKIFKLRCLADNVYSYLLLLSATGLGMSDLGDDKTVIIVIVGVLLSSSLLPEVP